MDVTALLLTVMAALDPAPATFDVAPPQIAPSQAHRATLAVKARARERAQRERRRWVRERRRIAAARKAERERKAREAAAAQAAQTQDRSTTSYGSGVERWRGLVAAYFLGHTDEALYVIRGESSGNPRASNGICRGLFQIHECHASAFRRITGLPYFDGVYDPEANVRFAAYMSRGGADWSAWSVQP